MKIAITSPDRKTTIEIECPDAETVGPFIIHPQYHGNGPDGQPAFGSRWTVSMRSGRALGAGAYKGPQAARKAAKAMAVLVQDETGDTLETVFGANSRAAFDAARPHFAA